MMFTVALAGAEATEPLAFALIHPFDAHPGAIWAKDQDLHMCRIREKHPTHTEFIPIRSIERGAMIAKDWDSSSDYFVVDGIGDGDMLLLLRELFPG